MDVFEKIAGLPYTYTRLQPVTEEEMKAFQDIHLDHIGLALWLRNLVNGEPLEAEAFNVFAPVQVVALIWKARLDLMTGLVPRVAFLHAVFSGSPIDPWFWWIAFEARMKVENIFYGDNPLSKSSHLKTKADFLETLSDLAMSDRLTRMSLSDFLSGEMFTPYRWGDWIQVQASLLAERDDFFSEHFFEPWLKAEKRLARRIYREAPIMIWKDGKWVSSLRGKRKS